MDMTIIALRQTELGFDCYADTLISFAGAASLNFYCKLLILPVKYRLSVSGLISSNTAQLGMAISGNLAAATAVFTILSGTLQSLHKYGTGAAPKDIDIINHAMEVADVVYEDTRSLGKNGLFEFFLFGICPREKRPFAVKIFTDLGRSGRYEISARNCGLGVGQLSLLGSGEVAFGKYIQENNGNGPEFSELFFRFIQSGEVKSVGGKPQVMVLESGEISIEPVLIGAEDGESCDIFHSGYKVGGYDAVGDYGIGLKLRGFNMDLFERRQALKAEGYNPDDENLSVSQVNQSIIQVQIDRHGGKGLATPVTGTLSITQSNRPKHGTFASYRCSSCAYLVKVFMLPDGVKRGPFKDQLKLSVICPACRETTLCRANSYQREIIA
jgi:hypothetical protein